MLVSDETWGAACFFAVGGVKDLSKLTIAGSPMGGLDGGGLLSSSRLEMLMAGMTSST